jgi:histidine triad (HIT) family protein
MTRRIFSPPRLPSHRIFIFEGDEMSQDCIFCKIVAGQIGGTPLYQDDQVTAFRDVNPQAPVHILIVPNKHLISLNEASDEDQTLLGRLMRTAAQLARTEGVAEDGYRLVANTGANGGQSVFHLHLHLLAGRRLTWPPG